MRIAIALVAVATLSTPALAQDRPEPRIVEQLDNPIAREIATQMVMQVADAVLATRVGPLAQLTDPRDDIRPNDTLADIKRREDPAFRRRLMEDTRRGVATAGAVAGGLVGAASELEATIARVRAALGPLGAISDYRDGDDRDY